MRKRTFLLALLTGSIILLALTLSGPANSVDAAPDLNTILYMPVIFKNYTDVPVTEFGILEGTVVDANDGLPIEDVHVCVYNSSYCADTDSDGYFELDPVPAGLRHLTISIDGWITISENTNIPANDTRTMFFGMSVTKDEPGQDHYLQIVLVWGPPWNPPPPASPGDLDSHLWITSPTLVHINASNEASYQNCALEPYACYTYDFDVTDGYGPEKIDIVEVQESRNSYGILNYDAAYSGVPSITETDAVVRVFEGNTHIATYEVPATGSGDFWYVFDIQRNGGDPTLQSVNCITDYSGENFPACQPPEE